MDDIDYSLLNADLVKKYFPQNNQGHAESIMFIQKCKKFNRYGISQERIFVLSTLGVYLFSSRRLHSMMKLGDLKYIVQSMQSKEFILQFDEGGDVRLNLEDREDLLMYVKMRFANINPNKGLKFFGIPNPSLKEFKGNNSSMYDNEPDPQYRLKD